MAEPKVDVWVGDDPANSARPQGAAPRVFVDDDLQAHPPFMLYPGPEGTPLGNPVRFDQA